MGCFQCGRRNMAEYHRIYQVLLCPDCAAHPDHQKLKSGKGARPRSDSEVAAIEAQVGGDLDDLRAMRRGK